MSDYHIVLHYPEPPAKVWRALTDPTIIPLWTSTGKTIIFCELGSGTIYRQSKDPRRAVALEPISLDHVLASTAIPLIFPARRVGNEFYCDGGLRLNTPIAPVIRAGAERLVIVSTTYVDRHSTPPMGAMCAACVYRPRNRYSPLTAPSAPSFLTET